MRYIIVFLTILLMPLSGYSERSASFQVSLVIPPIAGINVPGDTTNQENKIALYNDDKEMIREETTRDGKEFTLETIIPR